MRKIKENIKMIIALLIIIFPSSLTYGISLNTVNTPLVQANWHEVLKVLEKDEIKASIPVARILMGHAALATNNNNLSMELFLSVQDKQDIKAWSEWTDQFLQKNPGNPTALYLKGDAKARVGDIKGAIITFSEALTRSKQLKNNSLNALIYNARGVAHVANNEIDNAWVDLYQATMFDPNLADAHVNFGTLGVLKRVSINQSRTALDSFEKAIKLNNNFALAYNGMGCLYFGNGEFEKANQYFRSAEKLSPLMFVSELNQGFSSAYASKLVAIVGLDEKPGTSIESRFEQIQTHLREQHREITSRIPQDYLKKFNTSNTLSSGRFKDFSSINEIDAYQRYMVAKMKETLIEMTNADIEVRKLRHTIGTLHPMKVAYETSDAVFYVATGAFKAMKDIPTGVKNTARDAIFSIIKDENLKAVSSAIYDTKVLNDPENGLKNLALHSAKNIKDTIMNDESLRNINTDWIVPGNLPATIYEGTKRLVDLSFDGSVSRQARRHARGINLGRQYKNYQKALNDSGVKIKSYIKKVNNVTTIEDDRYIAPASYTNYKSLSKTIERKIVLNVRKQGRGGIDPNTYRRVIVVGSNSFKTVKMQEEFINNDISPIVLKPNTSSIIMDTAKRLGISAIVGIQQPKYTHPIFKRHDIYPDVNKVGIIQGEGQQPPPTPVIKHDWDWGKPYIPPPPPDNCNVCKGVVTRAKSIVDDGNWPVLTSFTLFYKSRRL